MAGRDWSAGLPSFPLGLRSVPRTAGGQWSGSERWSGRVPEHPHPEGGPLLGPGPMRGQVQEWAALWSGQPGGHGDDVAAQGRATGGGMPVAGQA